jgi:coatomer subunit beta'
LLFYSSYGNEEGLANMADNALKVGKYNIAFEAYFILQNTSKCIEVLVKSKRVAEATIFAQAYAPSALPALIKQWGTHLQEQGLQYSPDDLPSTEPEKWKADCKVEE